MDERQKEMLGRVAPKREVQHVLEVINQVSNIERYSRDHMAKRENDLEHTGFCCMFAYFIARKLMARGVHVDLGVLLERATVHDIEEAMTGDVPRTTKYANADVTIALKKVGRDAALHLSAFLKVDFMHHWTTAKDESIEGRIMLITDMAAVVYKTLVEVHMYGNRGFMRVSEEVASAIGELMWQFQRTNRELLWVVEELAEILERVKHGHVDLGGFFRKIGSYGDGN